MTWGGPREKLILIGVIVYFFVIFAIGSVGLLGIFPNFEVNPEYINGMLTAHTILFGFWVILIATVPKETIKKFY